MDNFKQKFSQYIKMPEMRPFWYFLPFVIGFFIVEGIEETFHVQSSLIFIFNSLFFIAIAIFLFIISLRLARANLEVKLEHNELSSIISTLQSGIVAYDPNFKITIFNKIAEGIFGLRSDEIIGKIFTPENIKEPRLKLFIQTMFPSLAPAIIKRSDPGVYPQIVDVSFGENRLNLRVATNKIIDPAGNLLGFVKIIVDRTREVELIKSKSEFIGVAAHQLRTPITSLHWMFESLSGESLSDNAKQIVNSGLEQSAFVSKIVNDLLDVSQIEEGRFGFNFGKVNIGFLIDEIIGSAKSFVEEAGIKIFFQKPVEPIELNVDSQKLSMALYNILDNAVRYNVKNGEVRIDIEKLADKPYVQIAIRDTGIGIPPVEIDKLFTKFFRAENAIRYAPNGSGLALYIAKNIIKRHGGDIRAESEINRGSVFYITLPTDSSLIPPKEIVYES
ncbi:hypothetical protein HZC33_01645 [Candidatus Wolfebacteria bacterium]|nr:hypothetical protein [Candidatus Wolfebacteria bacterium]